MTDIMKGVISIGLALIAVIIVGVVVGIMATQQNNRYDRLRKDCLDRGYSFVTHGLSIEQTDCIPLK